ncbi:MAG: hypothetical protein AAF632_20630 [Bacteroidota bacterium]
MLSQCTQSPKSGTIAEHTRETCTCPLEKSSDTGVGKKSKEATTQYGGEAGTSLDIPLKKLVRAEVGVAGGYQHENTTAETIYWKVLESNPEITQYANLYQATTCALFEIACQDQTLSARDREVEKRQIIREYTTQLEAIVQYSQEKASSNSSKTASLPARTSTSTQLSSSLKNYLNASSSSDVAILPIGDRDHQDLSLILRDWLEDKEFQVSTHLFLPDFLGEFRNHLRSRDASVFTKVKASQYTNCVCLFDQSVQLTESTLAGDAMITAIASGELTIFDLHHQTQSSHELKMRGAGITIDRAMESVAEKLQIAFSSLNNQFATCR